MSGQGYSGRSISSTRAGPPAREDGAVAHRSILDDLQTDDVAVEGDWGIGRRRRDVHDELVDHTTHREAAGSRLPPCLRSRPDATHASTKNASARMVGPRSAMSAIAATTTWAAALASIAIGPHAARSARSQRRRARRRGRGRTSGSRSRRPSYRQRGWPRWAIPPDGNPDSGLVSDASAA